MSKIIVMGSARSDGHTFKAIKKIISLQGTDNPLVDLLKLRILPYDYKYENVSDGFMPLLERIIDVETIIFATPVYWYTMSSILKTFIDRLSDLLDIRKDLGRKLRGKKVFVIASYGTSLPIGFEDAFEQTCTYLGMTYLGCSFVYNDEGDVSHYKDHTQQEIIKAKNILFKNGCGT